MDRADAADEAVAAARAVLAAGNPAPIGEKLEWSGEILNWMTWEGGDETERPPEQCKRQLRFFTNSGYGGVLLRSDEPFGEVGVYVELSDEGLHLIVDVPEKDEPALNAYVRKDGVVIAAVHKVEV